MLSLCMSSPVASLPALKAIPVMINVANVIGEVNPPCCFLSKKFSFKNKADWSQIILRDSAWIGNFC